MALNSLVLAGICCLLIVDFGIAQIAQLQFAVRRPAPFMAPNGDVITTTPGVGGGNGSEDAEGFQIGFGGLERRHFAFGQTITYTIIFRNFADDRFTLGRVIESDPLDPKVKDYVEIPPNEGRIGITMQLQKARYLTTILIPNLYTTRAVVLRPRGLAFEVSVLLKGNGNKPDTFQGVGVELPIDDPRYEANAPITLRWPIDWSTLSEYASDGKLTFELTVAIRNRRQPYRYSFGNH